MSIQVIRSTRRQETVLIPKYSLKYQNQITIFEINLSQNPVKRSEKIANMVTAASMETTIRVSYQRKK